MYRYDLKGNKKLLFSTETGQFSTTWKVWGQGQGLDPSRSRPRTSKTVLEAKDVLEFLASYLVILLQSSPSFWFSPL